MRETLHQQLFICTESLYPEIAGEGRINTSVLDVNPTKARNRADNVASEPLWYRLSIAREQL